MLNLLTGNPPKYAPFADELTRMQITLRVPDFDLPELQEADFLAVLEHKSRFAAEALGEPCLVDDGGLLLDAYPGFPGPLTRNVLQSLSVDGFERLLAGATDRASMVCYLGCFVQNKLWHWRGEISGRLDPRRPMGKGPGPLASWFIPDDPGDAAELGHRRKALQALEQDILKLREAFSCENVTADAEPRYIENVSPQYNPSCVFCQEFDGSKSSIYHDLLGQKLPSRLIHATEHFFVFPPLGEFIEGGLLITTREHYLSMAHLPDRLYDELDRLMAETSEILQSHYGCDPLFFEHAPVSSGEKGTCCVDHAHLNVFPVQVEVHDRLKNKFPFVEIGGMRQLSLMPQRNHAYLFLQTNAGTRFVYDSCIVPSQYIRKIITEELGMPERWHWREYLGLEELERTYAALLGWRTFDATH
jgi:inosine/xanthosine triphosphate pyrophosphatase family protein/diadenosine tetraphosphate (Ap4A) HIT family hydrolase